MTWHLLAPRPEGVRSPGTQALSLPPWRREQFWGPCEGSLPTPALGRVKGSLQRGEVGGGDEQREGRSKGETGTRLRKRQWEKEDEDGSRLKTDGEEWARKHPQPRQGGRGTHGPWP